MVGNIKETWLNGYVYDFGVDYDANAVDDILDIHKYLMKKKDIKQCLDDFGVDYDANAVDDILDIHKYLMKKKDIKQCLDLFKKYFL